jgi:preprotein translocase subunit SecE
VGGTIGVIVIVAVIATALGLIDVGLGGAMRLILP